MTRRVKPTTTAARHASEIILMVGLIGALVWSIHGKSCSGKDECKPEISCHSVRWSCNGTDTDSPTAAPTQDPLNTRCCVHLGTCGGDVEVAGWINVRNSSIELDGVPYSAQWLDTFVTEGNATQPAIIKSTYAGSWSTLKQAGYKFPSQMFVAEPTNSCTVDGDPKWPEWYQVTVNVINGVDTDGTLEIEGETPKDCLCDVEWDCLDSACWVETQNTSEAGASLSKTNSTLEDKVAKFCRSSDNVTIANYTASSYFALGFGPDQTAIDSFNFNTSVEGGWGPDLDDTNMWIQVELTEDTIISGIMTQGVAVNPERRVDEFMVEYEASDSSTQIFGSNMLFKAGARLDTKMINSFPTPIKANRVKLLISKPCDPYYVGLRFALLGCLVCDTNGDCTESAGGVCEPQKFCTYQEATTTVVGSTTAAGDTTTVPAGQTTAVPASETTAVPASETTADQAITPGDSQTTSAATPVPPTKGRDPTTAVPGMTTTPQPVQTATEQTSGTPPASLIEDRVAEATQGLPPKVKTVVEDLILIGGTIDGDAGPDPSAYPKENVTGSAVQAGLNVIRNITVDANTTKNNDLQVDIVKSAWNFLVAVAGSNAFVENGNIDENLLSEYMDVSSLILDEDRKEAWKQVQEESIAGPLGIVTSVEELAQGVAESAAEPFNLRIEVDKPNIVGLISGSAKEQFQEKGYVHNFSSENPKDWTEVTISKEAFLNDRNVKNLPVNDSLVVVVLKFSSIADVLDKNDVQDKTPPNGKTKRVGSDILSISVVSDGTISMPVSFRLGHEERKPLENQVCNFWKPHNKIIGEWSKEGCVTSDEKVQSTKCTCSHMTNYAVLMWLGEEPPPADGALDIITKVGLLVSISALALAVGLLLFLRSSLNSERIVIHMHLMSVTLVALILFLVAVDKTENKLVCQFITIALHFFYLSMFSWMLVEGIHLYRQIIAVFESEKSRLWVYFAIGWGIPIIVVGTTSGIFFDKYKDHDLCWLSVLDGSIWAFLGGMIPILLVNLVVLFMVSRIVMSAAKLQQEKPAFNSAKAGLRSSLLLLPILGITWVFGYFAHYHAALQYMFVTLNSFQGFFMALFHCFMSSEVNSALKQKIRKVKESSLGGASTVDSSHKPAMFTSGIRKVKVCPSQTDNTNDY
ncbi:adhesion G protein-coupled receptor L1-like [Patiria miniata]|uniref:Uncharacterized protein n=1 Tax=Patiria miniata TaxID=46514 RepID=A0A914APF5_PATMI|nr:adhesion G protein-coupled receptor L1-like [Patiria miniata]